jgi:hypothetical protein
MRSLLLLALAAAPEPADVPEYHAENPRAAVVTEATLLENERFWPYQAAKTDDGSIGVLIRIEEGGKARLDFGRDGKRELPISATDLVARANQVRTGELDKVAPNFVYALGPRLVDSAAETLRPVRFSVVAEKPGFVCVFADPGAANFAEIAAGLAPLYERHGVMTILFPQGEHPDPALREKLRALKWTVPFVFDHLSEPYTRSLLDEGTKPPTIVLLTSEGRVLYESAWRPEAVPELTNALVRAFGGKPAAPLTNSSPIRDGSGNEPS